eukprot:g60611.t1
MSALFARTCMVSRKGPWSTTGSKDKTAKAQQKHSPAKHSDGENQGDNSQTRPPTRNNMPKRVLKSPMRTKHMRVFSSGFRLVRRSFNG